MGRKVVQAKSRVQRELIQAITRVKIKDSE